MFFYLTKFIFPPLLLAGEERWIKQQAVQTEGFYVMSPEQFANWVRDHILSAP